MVVKFDYLLLCVGFKLKAFFLERLTRLKLYYNVNTFLIYHLHVLFLDKERENPGM